MALGASRVYVISLTGVTINTAITFLQLKLGAASAGQLIRFEVGQVTTTTLALLAMKLIRKTAAATMTNSLTPRKLGPASDPASSADTSATGSGSVATIEGTDGAQIREGVLNYQTGFLFAPGPKELPVIDVGGTIAAKFPSAPGSGIALWGDLIWEELF